MTILEIYSQIDKHLIEDKKPSIFLNEISNDAGFNEFPLNMLAALKNTEQSPVHHPEGNAWNHTMLVIDEAAKQRYRSKDKKALMWAALLHDIAKPQTTKIRRGKITSYDHDKNGESLSREFLKEFNNNEAFIQKVSKLVRYHMQILFVVNSLPFADIKGMKDNTDVEEIALLGYCDRMGRTNSKERDEKEAISIFLRKCRSYN